MDFVLDAKYQAAKKEISTFIERKNANCRDFTLDELLFQLLGCEHLWVDNLYYLKEAMMSLLVAVANPKVAEHLPKIDDLGEKLQLLHSFFTSIENTPVIKAQMELEYCEQLLCNPDTPFAENHLAYAAEEYSWMNVALTHEITRINETKRKHGKAVAA